jgi:ABC-type lipoprotein release transport system permease subunit
MFVAVILAPVAESFVFGVAVRDFVVYAGSAVVVLVTAVAASWLPGRRAAGLDPAALLRSD